MWYTTCSLYIRIKKIHDSIRDLFWLRGHHGGPRMRKSDTIAARLSFEKKIDRRQVEGKTDRNSTYMLQKVSFVSL